MITRIVKLSIQPALAESFEEIFYNTKPLIDGFEGCRMTNLFNDVNQQGQYFTISYWESEEALENYRQSDLFRSVWAQVKPLFAAKAEAWSLSGPAPIV